MRSRRARRVYYTTSHEYETEIESGGVRLSLFVARESSVLIKRRRVNPLRWPLAGPRLPHRASPSAARVSSSCWERVARRVRLGSADGSTHTESNKLNRKVKPRARPNVSSRQRPKRAPIRRRSQRRQRGGEPQTEHGLGVLFAVKGLTPTYSSV